MLKAILIPFGYGAGNARLIRASAEQMIKDQLKLTEYKVILKDSIISNYIQKDTMYEQRIKKRPRYYYLL